MDEPIADLLRLAAAVYFAAYLMGMRVTSRLTVALARRVGVRRALFLTSVPTAWRDLVIVAAMPYAIPRLGVEQLRAALRGRADSFDYRLLMAYSAMLEADGHEREARVIDDEAAAFALRHGRLHRSRFEEGG